MESKERNVITIEPVNIFKSAEEKLDSVIQYNKVIEHLPFGQHLREGCECIINDILGEHYFEDLNVHIFKKETYNAFYNMLFNSLNFNDIIDETDTDKEVTQKYLDNHEETVSVENKTALSIEYSKYVTKRFFEKYAHLKSSHLAIFFINYILGTVNFVKNHADKLIKKEVNFGMELLQMRREEIEKNNVSAFQTMKFYDLANNKLKNSRKDEREVFIEKIINAKQEIISNGKKATKNKTGEYLGYPKSTFYESLKKYKIDFDSL